MIREVRLSEKNSAYLINDGNALLVLNKPVGMATPDDRYIMEFFSDVIDMDGWKHSWHMNVKEAKTVGSKERKELYRILDDKIAAREEQLRLLKDAKEVLNNWKEEVLTAYENPTKSKEIG
jgi:hypothetical protein